MIVHPVVIVHGMADARRVLAVGVPVTLLSAPGAASFAGCLWWRELLRSARAEFPTAEATDVLDCGGASGMAMAALRSDVCRLVLHWDAPGRPAVCQIAERAGGFVLPRPPHALDMATPNATRHLHDWLHRSNPPNA